MIRFNPKRAKAKGKEDPRKGGEHPLAESKSCCDGYISGVCDQTIEVRLN